MRRDGRQSVIKNDPDHVAYPEYPLRGRTVLTYRWLPDDAGYLLDAGCAWGYATRYYDTTPSGELISKLTYNVERVARAASNAITILVRDTFTVIFLVAWMLYLNPGMALGAFVVAPVLGLIIRYITRRFRRDEPSSA